MTKKVRYPVGALAAIPALALAIPAYNAAPASHTGKPVSDTGKSVRTIFAHDTAALQPMSSVTPSSSAGAGAAGATCVAKNGHHAFASGVYLKFWSKPVSGRTCIGTIIVSGVEGSISGAVTNKYGRFCAKEHLGHKLSYQCRHVFRRDRLAVVGTIISPIAAQFLTVVSSYPFNG